MLRKMFNRKKPTIDPPVRAATDAEIRAVKARAKQLGSEGVNADQVLEILAKEIGTTVENVANFLAANVPDLIEVKTHEQAAEINAKRTAKDGYVSVGDTVKG